MDFAELDDIVTITYTLKYRTGDIFDTNVGKGPVKFKLGSHIFIKGLEKAVLGMRIGDVKTITIPPQEAFGAKRDDLIFEIPKENVPANVKQEVGQRVEITVPELDKIYGEILEVNKDMLIIDANPRQAGQYLILTVHLNDIEQVES